jgi:hypothetical protein
MNKGKFTMKFKTYVVPRLILGPKRRDYIVGALRKFK